MFISSFLTHIRNSFKNKYTNTKPEFKKINYENKQIYFLSIIHIGTKEYYNEKANKIDSLQSKGYKILYEGNYLLGILHQSKMTKYNKITGFDILLPYSKIYPYSEYSKKYNLIDQPNYAGFNMSSKNSESADLTIES